MATINRQFLLTAALLLFCNVVAVAEDARLVESSSPPGQTISVERLQPHLNYLASPDRQGRDDWGKIESRDYIIGHFKSLGLQPLFEQSYIQVVPEFGNMDQDPKMMGQNVGAFVPGTDPKLRDEWVVVNAHYDHLGVKKGKIYPGADDNASGVAMLLEVAREFSKSPARRSVAFVAFDLEEHLLWGSRWFVAHAPMKVDSIKFCLTADMIGRSLGGLESPTVFVMGSERSPEVREILDQTKVPDGLEIAKLGVDMVNVRSDYGPFFVRRIPFLFFSTGEHPDYHTPNDTLDKLNVPKIARISGVMHQIARGVANDQRDITWNGFTPPELEEVQAINRIAKRLLQADDDGDVPLTDLQRFFVSQVRAKTNYMLGQKRVTHEERKWLVRSTQFMLLSIF